MQFYIDNNNPHPMKGAEVMEFVPPNYQKSDVDNYLIIMDNERGKLTKKWFKRIYPIIVLALFSISYGIRIVFYPENINEVASLTRILFYVLIFSLFLCPVHNWYKKASLPEAERFLRKVLCYPLLEKAKAEDIKKIHDFCSGNKYYE